jgi:hypothetical protein
MILDGRKTWELRGSRTIRRGRIALIASGTGTILGEASITSVVGPLDIEELRANSHKHCVVAKWASVGTPYLKTFAWELQKPVRYDCPRPYDHPAGAVVWVKLREAAAAAVRSDTRDVPRDGLFLTRHRSPCR